LLLFDFLLTQTHFVHPMTDRMNIESAGRDKFAIVRLNVSHSL